MLRNKLWLYLTEQRNDWINNCCSITSCSYNWQAKQLSGCLNFNFFNLRSSDIIRYFGDIENSIRVARFDLSSGELLQNDEDYFSTLIKNKVKNENEYTAAWFVSNCNHTSGALRRWEYGESLMKEKRFEKEQIFINFPPFEPQHCRNFRL